MKIHSIVIGAIVALGASAPAHAGLLGGGGSVGGSFAGGLTGSLDRAHGAQSAGTAAGDLQASRIAKPPKDPSPGATRKPTPGPAANAAVAGEAATHASRSTAVDGNLTQRVESTVDSSHAATSTGGSGALSLTRTEATQAPQAASTSATSSGGAATAQKPAPTVASAPGAKSAPTPDAAPRPPRNELSASGSSSAAASASVER
jgi:hypothetical protein